MAQGIRIQRLESLAENKPFKPSDYAIVGFNEAGDPIIGSVPNMRTLNVVKKGFDAMLEGARHPITGRLTEEGRAIDAVRRSFLAEIDRFNPEYALARKNYASFMQVNDAMEFGRKSLTMSPPAVKAKMAALTDIEKAGARVGAAEELRKAIDTAGYTNNAILKIFNSRQRVQNLRALFDNDLAFAEFRKTIFQEARKRATYEAVKGNSTTASQLADMFEAGGTNEVAQFAGRAVTQGPITATLQWVGSALRRLGGLTPEVADQIARRLMSSSPAETRMILNELSKIDRMKISADQKARLVQALLTKVLTSQSVAATSASG